MDDLASRNERLCENASVLTKAAEELASGYAELKDLELERVDLSRERKRLIAELTQLEAVATDDATGARLRASLDALVFEKLQDRRLRTQEGILALELIRQAIPVIDSLTARIGERRRKPLKKGRSLLDEMIEHANQVLKQSRFDQTRTAAQRLEVSRESNAGDSFVDGVQALIRGGYSAQAYEYQNEIGLRDESFLGLLHMLANDGEEALEIENPPARVRAAIRREEGRSQRRLWKRSQQFAPDIEANLADSCLLESSVIAGVDWARGIQTVDLSEDQKLAVAAKSDGLDLQSSEAPEYLGMDSARVSSIRRSLGSDRRAGKRLRKYFKVYKTAKSPAQGSTSDLREDQSTIK